MYISKSILLSVFALALTAASVATLIYMDIPFGLKADGREFHSAQPAATDDHALWCESPLATAQEVHDHEVHVHDDSHDGHDGGSRSIQKGDFATNSGVISDSQFSDGGFGDIGQQWWNVHVGGHVINVHISGDGTAIVGVGSEVHLDELVDGALVGEAPVDPPPTTTTTPPAPVDPPTTTTLPPSTGDTDTGDTGTGDGTGDAGAGDAGSGNAVPDPSDD